MYARTLNKSKENLGPYTKKQFLLNNTRGQDTPPTIQHKQHQGSRHTSHHSTQTPLRVKTHLPPFNTNTTKGQDTPPPFNTNTTKG